MQDQKGTQDGTIPKREKNGLVLPGGGARGAYQVGVLKAVAELVPPGSSNPFPILTGTSAGAINATVLAAHAQNFRLGVTQLGRVWKNFRAEQVFRSDALTMAKTSMHWLVSLVTGGLLLRNPKSLLNNAPLCKLLEKSIPFSRIQNALDKGHLDALAVTASGYGSSRSVSFFQAAEHCSEWGRVRRIGRRAHIHLDHLMASVAVPLIFPPVRIGREYYGDGAMRQNMPLSPAIHLGAERILVIGVRDEHPDEPDNFDEEPDYPSFGQIAGYMLDTLFLDGLYADIERLTRLNMMVEQVETSKLHGPSSHLKCIECLVIVPSEDIREIARRHVHELPAPVRMLLTGLGAMQRGGRQLISYLLFEQGYTRELMELGYRDAMAQEDHLRAFLHGEQMPTIDAPESLRRDLSGEEKRPQSEE